MREFDIYAGKPCTIRKDGDLITCSKYDMTISQYRILLCLIGKIKSNDSPDTTYTLTTREYFDLCRFYPRKKYSSNELHRGIRSDILQIANVNGIVDPLGYPAETFSWLDKRHITFHQENKRLCAAYVRFDPSVAPMLFGLSKSNKQTLRYDIYNVLAFKNRYSIRLYEMLRFKYFRRPHIVMTLSALRQRLGVPDEVSYVNARFSSYALEPCIEEINKYSDINVYWELWKAGMRNFTHAMFNVSLASPEECQARRQLVLDTLRAHPGANKEVSPNGRPNPAFIREE